jgi:phospholipase C
MPNRCWAVGLHVRGPEALSRPAVHPVVLSSAGRGVAEPCRFSHDADALIIDPKYAPVIPRYFDKSDVLGHASFVERAAKGQLPAVSWIDPNFIDLTFGPAGSNDDHPPSDLHAGQKLALELFDAVVQGPLWEKTMVIVTYDEHGGFYDHVPRPPARTLSAAPLLGPRGGCVRLSAAGGRGLGSRRR